MDLVLCRVYLPDITIGALYCGPKFVCFTIELPWRENQRQVSCIPEGLYSAQYEHHVKFGHVYRIENVKNRSGILIHTGNRTSDIRGCILPVTKLHPEPQEWRKNQIFGQESHPAMVKIIELVNKKINLTITSGMPGQTVRA